MKSPEATIKAAQYRRWVAAPKSARLPVPAVIGVYLFDGETVEWFWTHTAEGSYVSGYQINAQSEGHQANGHFVGI